jgi:hypothetical protein
MGKMKNMNAPAKNTNGGAEVTRVAPGKSMVRSGQTGDPLPLPEQGSPDHSPVIPWKPVDNGHKPFKI